MNRRMVSSVLFVFLFTSFSVSVLVTGGLAWSNGGYSADPSNPDYGTHDWIQIEGLGHKCAHTYKRCLHACHLT